MKPLHEKVKVTVKPHNALRFTVNGDAGAVVLVDLDHVHIAEHGFHRRVKHALKLVPGPSDRAEVLHLLELLDKQLEIEVTKLQAMRRTLSTVREVNTVPPGWIHPCPYEAHKGEGDSFVLLFRSDNTGDWHYTHCTCPPQEDAEDNCPGDELCPGTFVSDADTLVWDACLKVDELCAQS